MSAVAARAPLRGKRVLIAKPGLDGHDVGAKVIALALRDAGADVIYTGLRKSPEAIARAAVDEDVHAVGLSVLSASSLWLRALGGGDVAVFVGGTIPPADHAVLRASGVKGVFTSDLPLEDVVAAVARALA